MSLKRQCCKYFTNIHEHEKWTEMNNWFRIFLYVGSMQKGRIKTFGYLQNKYAWVASIFKVNTSLFQSISLQIKQTVSAAKINLIRQQPPINTPHNPINLQFSY